MLIGATHPVGCVALKTVSVAVKVTIAQLFSLVAHANLTLTKVVSGEVA